jgi:acyl-CoA reductase-like NAD-dependent aldehyde dehydrogenase
MEVINPATGARLALVAEHTDAEIEAAAAACRRAQIAWTAAEARLSEDAKQIATLSTSE